jgi:hypothetical protein
MTRTTTGASVIAFCWGFQVLGQPPAVQLQFAVASIKPHLFTGGRGGANMARVASTPARINFQATTAGDVITFAYGFPGGRIEGRPQWLYEDSYDIAATTPSPASLAEQKLSSISILRRWGTRCWTARSN